MACWRGVRGNGRGGGGGEGGGEVLMVVIRRVMSVSCNGFCDVGSYSSSSSSSGCSGVVRGERGTG